MKLLFVLLLALVPVPCLAGFFVGNGGEGVRTENGLVLRDFHEASLSTPYMGSVADAAITAKVAALPLGNLVVSRDLLARKLTDLQSVQLHLGRALLDVMASYRWVLVDQTLPLLPDDGSVFSYPDSQRVQIANRFQTTVYVAKAAWQQLSSESQVGLLVHEALYSLQTPQCESSCRQFSYKTRELVGLIFLDPSVRSRAFSAAQAASIGVAAIDPNKVAAKNCVYDRKDGEFEAFRNRDDFGAGKLLNRATLQTSDIETQVDAFCSVAARLALDNAAEVVGLDLWVSPYVLGSNVYKVTGSEGQVSDQIQFQLIYQAPRIQRADEFGGAEDCRTSLEVFTKSWHEGRIYPALNNEHPCDPILMGIAAAQ